MNKKNILSRINNYIPENKVRQWPLERLLRQIERYQINEQEMSSEIVDQFEYLIRRIAGKFKNKTYYNDLLQAGRLGALVAIRKVVPQEHVESIHKYIGCYITEEIMKEARSNINKEVALDDTIPVEFDETQVDLDIRVLKMEEYNILLRLIGRLPIKEYEIIMAHISGETFGEIGKRLGQTETCVRTYHNRIINKLRILAGLK